MKVKVIIIHSVNDLNYSSRVECSFIDTWGYNQIFIEKIPVVTSNNFDIYAEFPQNGVIACEIIKSWRDKDNREFVSIDTSKPWGCEIIDEISRFDILKTQLIN